MKRNLYVSVAASVVLMAGGPVAAAAAVTTDTARTTPASATAPRADVTAEGAAAAALRKYPGVVESLEKDGSDWHVDVIGKDGRSHAEVTVKADGKATAEKPDRQDPDRGDKALLAAKVTAAQAAKAAAATSPGEIRSVQWEDGDGKAPYWHVEGKTKDSRPFDGAVNPTTGKVGPAPSDSDTDDNDDDN
ncbi:hypothetical protein [Streptomyces sp. NPDC091268]|uniref:hypothetical protein n=1 Tax=Streptomyces sp. NPDC091268 TaxID=3365979 RepID=UPI00380C2AE9